MSSKPSVSSAMYFEELSTLTRELAALDIAVIRSEYHMAAFGSWLMEAESKGKLVRVVWDDKDSWLALSVAKKPHGGDVVQWQKTPSPNQTFSGYQEIFAKSREFVLDQLAS